MGKQPAVIIIARHGARLDAADKSWHLSSPTPYDPPLTYGGWTQSRSLGLRIACLLEQRQETLANNELAAGKPSPPLDPDKPRRKRKYKVVIHSSPFTRCLQTSIGISAGLSQYQTIRSNEEKAAARQRSGSNLPNSPRLHAVDTSILAARNSLRKSLQEQRSQQSRATLRVDASLGEWLSPDYFDNITPPPPSNLMVATAKSYLVRRAEGIDSYSNSQGGAKGLQGNLWNSGGRASESIPTPKVSDGPLDMKSLAQTLPGRDRTSSYSSGRISPFGRPAVPARARSSEPPSSIGYTPPVPSYAISPIEPIPRGYVAHARDACVDVDHQWDSMRDPLSWGDGGDYGEEWSAMHKRFRKGLNHLIEWYEHHGVGKVDDEHLATTHDDESEDADDDDEDIVVVLVTHGAGCNALIGGLTEQPVLIDVGVASLTMAYRKDEPVIEGDFSPRTLTPQQQDDTSPVLERPMRRKASIYTGLSHKYEMKIVASADHLRPGSDPARPQASAGSNSPVLAASTTIPDSRRRSTFLSHATNDAPLDAGWSMPEYARGGVSTALGSIRRMSIQTGSTNRSPSVSSVTSTTGLWTPLTPVMQDPVKTRDEPGLTDEGVVLEGPTEGRRRASSGNKLGITYVPDNAHHPAMASGGRNASRSGDRVDTLASVTESPNKESSDRVAELPRVSPQLPSGLGRTLSQKGLWGSAPSGVQERDKKPKRRWTLQQQRD